MDDDRRVSTQPVNQHLLQRVHEKDYIRNIESGLLGRKEQLLLGLPLTPKLYQRSVTEVEATRLACHAALAEGVGVCLAGGTHHALRGHGEGYCVFNDVAIAIRDLQDKQPNIKIMVVDTDAHQGNGTAHLFARDDSVFTLSLHGEKNFPFNKECSDLDVALPDGCGDADYLAALELALDEMNHRFQPDLVIYLAGADPFEGDRLGRLKLSFDGLEARDRRVFDWCFARALPVAFVMAGGYGARIEDTVQIQINTYRTALTYWQRWRTHQAAALTGSKEHSF